MTSGRRVKSKIKRRGMGKKEEVRESGKGRENL